MEVLLDRIDGINFWNYTRYLFFWIKFIWIILMKKKIAILGSTGSIGRSTLEVIKKNKKNFDIILTCQQIIIIKN